MTLLKKEIKDEILILTLCDSSSRNAFSPSMAEEFSSAFTKETYKGILLKAEGRVFCSGGHLPFYKNLGSSEEGLKHNNRITEILDTFEKLPVPKVCVVDGLCVGGGVELIASFDKIYCTPQSLFGLWQRRVGLTFGWGGQDRLLKRISSRRLQNWLLDSQTLCSYQAKEMGLVDHIGLSYDSILKSQSWLKQINSRGEGSQKAILAEPNSQSLVFKNLWMAEEHKKALNKIKYR